MTLVERLCELVPVRVVMEAAAGYELAAATDLRQRNPDPPGGFARRVGQLAKSDSLGEPAPGRLWVYRPLLCFGLSHPPQHESSSPRASGETLR